MSVAVFYILEGDIGMRWVGWWALLVVLLFVEGSWRLLKRLAARSSCTRGSLISPGRIHWEKPGGGCAVSSLKEMMEKLTASKGLRPSP